MPEPASSKADPKSVLDEAFGTSQRSSAPSDTGPEDDYRVRIPPFEGPLDLLLHLIRKDQINIYDIPIAQICASYLKYLELMRVPDVNLAGEFMVMAATLILMKSAMLLPREEGEEQAEDPRKPLVQQLLEYERFKKAAQELDRLDWLYRDIYPRPPSTTQDVMPVEALLTAPLEPIDPYQLLVCLKGALSRTQRKPLVVHTDPVSIKEKVVQIGELLEAAPVVEFRSLLPSECRRQDVIVAFFAMLELARLKYIEIIQYEIFGPIHLRGVRPIRELNVALLDQF